MNTEFDMNKPYQTRDGLAVKELCRFSNGQFVGMIEGSDYVCTWQPTGHYVRTGPTNMDLINIPTKRTVWVNLYNTGNSFFHDSQASADYAATNMCRDGIRRLGGKANPIEIEE